MIYKIKYSIGGSASIHKFEKRIKKEISELEDKYQIIERTGNTITIQHKEFGKIFKIEFPSTWPWKSPIINGEIVPNWNPPTTGRFIKDIDIISNPQPTPERPSMLIYCHPRIVDFTKEDIDHWQKPIFEIMLTEQSINKEDIKVHTIDVIPGGSKQGDGFSESFIDFNENEFDIVILPDCGGLWFEYQNSDNDENFEKLKLLMIKLLKMVKPGGTIRFGKILNPDWYDRLIRQLSDSGYNTSISKYSLYGDGDIKYITIVKDN